MNKIAIIGAGGHSKVIADIFEMSKITIIGFYDDDKIDIHYGYKIIGKLIDIEKSYKYICGIGNNNIRSKIVHSLSMLDWINAIHPQAIISSSAMVDIGSIVCAGAILQPDVYIGKHSIINTKATIDHDCKIGDFVHIAPGVTICGGVNIDDNTLIGAGSIVQPNIKIGKNCIVGSGSNVIRDIPDNSKVIGNPGKLVT